MLQKATFYCLFLSSSKLRLLDLFFCFLDGIVQAAVRRQSESSEPLTPEPPDVPQRKRKKKKVPTGMWNNCRLEKALIGNTEIMVTQKYNWPSCILS